MTREEYRQLIHSTWTSGGWEYYWQHVNFPKLVETVAIECFIHRDLESPLAQETHRRLTQLRTIGETDQ